MASAQESWDEVPRLDVVRVLVVEDVADIRQFVVEVLEESGAQVDAVGSAVEGLDVLKRERPDVLLGNIVMPGEDGYWLIRQVRGLPPEQGGNTPAAAFTGDTTARDGLVIQMLASLGHTVLHATTGLGGLARLKGGRQ